MPPVAVRPQTKRHGIRGRAGYPARKTRERIRRIRDTRNANANANANVNANANAKPRRQQAAISPARYWADFDADFFGGLR
ncbi:MAG: hypothetical protein DBX55_06630 [Verrucomicrobia bacterium]|nr:MAG: hypothetical protein DBX55_06630 [Verrucomicrobiota bacterium]